MKNLLYLLLVISFNGAAQVNLDSLWEVWNDPTQADTNKLEAMNEICWQGYLFNQPDSAFYFAQMQYDLAKEKDEYRQMSAALNTQGVSFTVRGDYTKAIDYFTQCLNINKEIGDKQGVASAFNNFGIIYKIQGDYSKSIDYYAQCLKINEEISDKKGIAGALNNMGNIYFTQGNYASAVQYYTRSLKLKQEIGDKQGAASSTSNIGAIYKEQGDYAKAIDHYTQSLTIEKEIGNKFEVASTLNNIGNIYKEQKDYAVAIENYNQSLKIREEIDDKKGIASTLINIGVVYYRQNNRETAFEHYTRSLKISEEIGDPQAFSKSLHNCGEIYQDQGDFTRALDYGSRALAKAKEVGALLEIKNAANLLWEVNKLLGRHKDALQMHELYITSRDSLESEKNQKEVIRQEYKFAYEKQAAADSIKTAEANKVKDAQLLAEKAKTKQQQQQKYFLYGGLALALIFGGFIFNRFRVTKKQKGIIEEQKQRVEDAYGHLEEKNNEIMDSIIYAKRIQSAILPPQKIVKEYLQESFILYKPKDIVAGDFYWLEHKDGKILFAAADCTGHGVPGALVSVVCNNGLNRSVREHGLTDPGQILDKTREIVINEFEKSEDEVKDGMDIALCSLEGTTLKYAGANNPLWIIRNSEVLETKADKQPIGKFHKQKPYTTHTIELQPGDSIYIFSDGYVDQFGGEKGKKFKAKGLKELLLNIQDKSMEKQKQTIDDVFETWKGDLEQIDDVCVIGVAYDQ
jgi:tetratricopeptide (TPR) repeat protein